MTTFIDGPAAGEALLLKRAPVMLRVVKSAVGKWDALDQPGDEPRRGETVFVYRLQGQPTVFHLCRSPRKLSGWYQGGRYVFLQEQPDPAHVMTTAAWAAWCDANQARLLAEFAAADVDVKPEPLQVKRIYGMK